ncbi:MAG: hypothetical protein ACMUHB_01615, partial [Thermoplasmatota archaeon]
DSGEIKLEVDGVAQDVDFSLSQDGMEITIIMPEEVERGTATITISGLMDISGNEMETYTLDLEILKEEEDGDPDPTWMIILIIAVVVILLIVLIAVFALGKKEEDEEDSPDLPSE